MESTHFLFFARVAPLECTDDEHLYIKKI